MWKKRRADDATTHPAKLAGWAEAPKDVKARLPRRRRVKTRLKTAHSAALRAGRVRHPAKDESSAALVGAGAGWAGGLVAPAHGLGSGRNPGFGARGLFAGLVLGFLPME
jgi:hypothetical protein